MPETADTGLFASLAYPATDADRAICAAALAVAEASGGLSSMEHLDALLLVTHPDWCAAFLDASDAKAVKRTLKAAPKALVVGANTPINWKRCRDYLEQRGAIRVVRGDTAQSLQLASYRAT